MTRSLPAGSRAGKAFGQFLGTMKVAGRAFSDKLPRPEELIEEIVQLADASRRGGLVSLEGKEVSNEFLTKGIQLLVEGHDAEVVHDVLSTDLRETEARHDRSAKIFSAWGELGPTAGCPSRTKSNCAGLKKRA